MGLYFEDNLVRIFNGDARNMSELPDESVQCVVTSPPYWGLRKYAGLPDLIWGDNNCEHRWGNKLPAHHPGQVKDNKAVTNENAVGQNAGAGSLCSLCGAWKGQYGLEPTPELYIEHTLIFLREIRGVLRKDGVVFWNIGDSYAGSWGDSGHRPERTGVAGHQRQKNTQWFERKGHPTEVPPTAKLKGVIKPKDLCLIPFRAAISAQENGWWIRSVIIWSKPNPMPESVTDRPTESHEYIIMMTKNKNYYWDAEAVRERSISGDSVGAPQRDTRETYGLGGGNSGLSQAKVRAKLEGGFVGRNLRSVWEFPTQPYPEAHFAVFPEKLPEICIKAASKGGDIILDPFMGSGTTLWIAKKLGRRAVGYELSEQYCKLALERNRQMGMEI